MSDLWADIDVGHCDQQAADGAGSLSDSDDSCVGEGEEWEREGKGEGEEDEEGEGEEEEEGRDSVVAVSGLHPAVSSYMYSVMGQYLGVSLVARLYPVLVSILNDRFSRVL